MEIQKYIAELLSEHDCVIIPGLGGFVGSYLPAQIHSVYHTFQPPSKKILFNINLRQNDGLLANHIAQAEKVSFNEANEQIRLFADETIKALKTRKYLILQNIGKIYMGKEGNIQFDQDLRSNLLPESFGLQPFFSSPVKRDPHQDRIEKRIQSRRETKELVKRAIPKPLKWAAILAVPVAVATMLSLAGYDSIKSGSWNTADIFSSLSPFSKADVKQAPPEIHSSPILEMEIPHSVDPPTYRDPSMGPVRDKMEPVVTEDPVSEPRNIPSQTSAPQTGNFAVIVGAFGVESNAHRLVRKLNQEGIKGKIFDRSSGGLSRVAAGIFTTEEEAIRMMNTMKANGFPGAWILEK
ncbi:MAG: HU-CCDC81 and SPOR domain-containing protein [Bacteroidia bacterium]|nr:HU-CCDC81 and SPOR domain-containing protein [Bacteroidia bacterium]